MDAAALRDHCLEFPGSEETFPFGPETSAFKVAGKVFALVEDSYDLVVSALPRARRRGLRWRGDRPA